MWDIFKCCFSGSSHIEDNSVCQDYADYTITDKDIYIAALSDGASSSTFSNIAAMCNVNATINCLHRIEYSKLLSSNTSDMKSYILNACRELLGKQIKRIPNSSPIDFAATLMFIVSDGQSAMIGHLGDGVVCGAKSNRNINVLSLPDNINNQSDSTVFTVSKNAVDNFRITTIPDLGEYMAIFLMSDGPETSFYNTQTQTMYESNLLAIIDSISQEKAREMKLTNYLKANFWRNGITADDCSMVVFTREGHTSIY